MPSLLMVEGWFNTFNVQPMSLGPCFLSMVRMDPSAQRTLYPDYKLDIHGAYISATV